MTHDPSAGTRWPSPTYDGGIASTACADPNAKTIGCMCANTDPCCTAGQFTAASPRKVCRASAGPFDIEDVCDGLGSEYPVDADASPGAA